MKIMFYAIVAVFTLITGAAQAQPLVAQYTAFIAQDDLYNSSGTRLSAPWQVLRQDRANFHRFGIAQPGDQSDPFFDDAEDRAMMERMLANGYISPSASSAIMAGGAMVVVRIYSGVADGQRIEVDVYR